MASSTEPYLLSKWAYDTLHGDSVLMALTTPSPTVSVAPVPTGTTFPRIVIEIPSAAEDLSALEAGYAHIWSQPRLQISVISANENLTDINAISARINALLDGAGSVGVTNGLIVHCIRDWIIQTADLEADIFRAKYVQQYSTAVVATA